MDLGTFNRWADGVRNRESPPRIQVAPEGHALRRVQVCCGHVALIGGGTTEGKTALAMQMVFDAMRLPAQETLKVFVANVEMAPSALLDRELSRLSGVCHLSIRERTFQEDVLHQINATIDALRSLVPRLEFMEGPFQLDRLQEQVNEFGPDVIVVDYLQRFDLGSHRDARGRAAAVMETCRAIANQGRAVIALSAINRSSYGGDADFSAFRDSSDVEYGADVAYQLTRPNTADDCEVVLAALKNRHGVPEDIHLTFDGDYQQFINRPETNSGEEWSVENE